MVITRALLLVAAVAATATAPPAVFAGPPPVVTPNPGCCHDLYDVGASSATNAWAVGSYSNGGPRHSLALHWNGVAWRTVPTPPVGAGSELLKVRVLSRTDAWAVGSWETTNHARRTLALHWNGSSWRTVSTPSAGVLYDVAAVSPTSLWAVGAGSGSLLAMRWDGHAWRVVPTPVGTGGLALSGVAALSPSSAWAVGNRWTGTRMRTLVLRWDGRTWRTVPSPNAGTANNYLLGGVAAASPTSAWAVGSYAAGSRWNTLVLHWDGSAWRVVASPNPGTTANHLYGGISLVPGTNAVWAVGGASNGHGYRPLVLRWNGRTWQVSPAPIPTGSSELGGVTALGSQGAWAVGSQVLSSRSQRTLVLRWNGTSWRLW